MASYAQKADTTDIINFDQAQYGVVLEGGKKSLFYGKVEFSQKGVYSSSKEILSPYLVIRCIIMAIPSSARYIPGWPFSKAISAFILKSCRTISGQR